MSYAAEHTGTGQQVALKFMTVEDAEDDEFVVRFEQEARVMAGLRSPNTVRIYDFGRTDEGNLFMAMELLNGQTLDKRVRELVRQGTTMGESEAAVLGIQILRSLVEAHGKGLVHRDLKPGNVFLTDDGSDDVLAKVLDFGIARVAGSNLTGAGRLLGTPAFMSPEQWRAERPDGRADLYAVGCILYCCVTGRPPFRADNPMALLKAHMVDPVPDPRPEAKTTLSDGFVHVMLTAMAKDPGERYPDARSMRVALEAVVGGAWAGTPHGQVPSSQFPTAPMLPFVEDAMDSQTLAWADTDAAAGPGASSGPGPGPDTGTDRVARPGKATVSMAAPGVAAAPDVHKTPRAAAMVALGTAVAVGVLAAVAGAVWWLLADPVPHATQVSGMAVREVPAIPQTPPPAVAVSAPVAALPTPAVLAAPAVDGSAAPADAVPTAKSQPAAPAIRPPSAAPAAKPTRKKAGGTIVEEVF